MASDFDWFFNYFPVLSKPKEALPHEKPRASFVAGLKNFVLSALFYAAFTLLLFFVLGLEIKEPEGSAILGGFFSILIVIGIPIGSVLLNAAVFATAKLLGGKGEFSTQYFLSSLYAMPLVLFIVVASLILSPILALVAVFFSGLYYLTLCLMEAHEFSMTKAVASWLIPGVILSVLLLAAFFFMAVVIYAATTKTAG